MLEENGRLNESVNVLKKRIGKTVLVVMAWANLRILENFFHKIWLLMPFLK